MEVSTVAVERRFVENVIRMTGKLDYDETRLRHITAWTPGRIVRLYADFTGTTVARGDHMALLYSPQLISAQAELLEAAKAVENLTPDSSQFVRRSALATLEASREKMRLLGLRPGQISQIENSREPAENVTIYAPAGGIVVEKHTTEGMYVDTGTKIYTIADLSHLWLKLDAYESDMMWIRYGQRVEFTAEAYPGEVFTGRLSFIEPVVDERTRAVKLRVNVDNEDLKLKPGMFVRALVRATVAGDSTAMDPDMAGKWICPMHPGVVAEAAGKCGICEMDLVTAESLGYVPASGGSPPLVVPASAVLVTGRRAVVYVRAPGRASPTFEGREVVLGPRAGDWYIVESGLAEGEQVVTNGNFKIDSAMQIQAKPSMMVED
jgi:Cu(I)/Ag(I) efflux system membrane fusion protein